MIKKSSVPHKDIFVKSRFIIYRAFFFIYLFTILFSNSKKGRRKGDAVFIYTKEGVGEENEGIGRIWGG